MASQPRLRWWTSFAVLTAAQLAAIAAPGTSAAPVRARPTPAAPTPAAPTPAAPVAPTSAPVAPAPEAPAPETPTTPAAPDGAPAPADPSVPAEVGGDAADAADAADAPEGSEGSEGSDANGATDATSGAPTASDGLEEPGEAATAPQGPVGTVKGIIIDPDTREGAIGAIIEARRQDGSGEPATVFSEADGSYALSLPPGGYALTFSTPGAAPITRTVTVVAETSQVIDLMPDLSTEVVEVYDTIDLRSDSGLLAQRRASATVSDSIGAEQISRSPDSSASDAVKRMVAATLQDNRYVVIRGLGGRYSMTLLNGVPVPSPDPDIPAAPLDLFPASMVTNLTINKSFAPDQPGQFAGGALSIDTRTYPSSFTFRAKASLSGDSESSLRTVHAYGGGGLDALGYDDGTRALPSAIPSDRLAGGANLPAEQRAAQASSFRNNWTLEDGRALPNFGLSATVGDTVKVKQERLGYLASVAYGHSTSRRVSHLARVGEADGAGGHLPSVLQLDDDQGTRRANLSALAAASVTLTPDHQVNALALYTHSADDSASQVTGVDNSTAVIDRTRLRFLERSLTFLQLVGDDRLAEGKVRLAWQGNLARVAQREPDTRDLLRTATPGGYVIDRGSGSAERLFSELDELSGGGGVDATWRLRAASLKVGAALTASQRDYQARRFHFDVTGETARLEPQEAFDTHNAGNGMSLREATLPTDGYSATRSIAAAYAMAELAPTPDLRVLAGARLERSALTVGLSSKIELMAPPTADTTREDDAILPSVSAVYAVTGSSNLRAAYGLTVARPNFREVSPALYYDYVRRRAIGGNPELEQTSIHNFDLRWETFLGTSEVLAASLFAKRFVKPIEQTLEDAGDGQNVSFANAEGAESYGLELEARLSLGRLTPALSAFSIGGNLSLIGSKIELGGADRALQGQSPYVANLGVAYASHVGTRVDVLYNSFGRRIEEVGTGGAGDVYEEPFHRLDFTVSQDVGRGTKLKLSGTNLLNQRVVRTQDGVEILAYPVGVAAIGSVELSL
ncbi:MAG: TonB-dependent receptor [Kofleriaceae bacterium]